MDKQKAAAFLIGCSPEELINFREEAGLGKGVITLGPDGKKYRFSVEQLEKASKAAAMTLTLQEAAKPEDPEIKLNPDLENILPEKTQSPSKTGKSSKSSKSSGSSRSSRSSKSSRSTKKS